MGAENERKGCLTKPPRQLFSLYALVQLQCLGWMALLHNQTGDSAPHVFIPVLLQLPVLKQRPKPCKQNAPFLVVRVNASVRHERVEVFTLVTNVSFTHSTLRQQFAVKNNNMLRIEISLKFKKEKLLACVQMEF